MRDGGLATDTEDVTRAGRGGPASPGTGRRSLYRRPDQTCSAHGKLHLLDLLSRLKDQWMLQTNFSRSLKLPSQASVLPPGRRQTGDRRRKVVMLDEFDLEHGAGTCTRAANEPSQSLKFYNHVDVLWPFLLVESSHYH